MKLFKNKNKKRISIFYQNFIIIGSFFLLYILFKLNFKDKLKHTKISAIKRKLFTTSEKQKSEDICQKADKDLILLYKNDSYFYIKENITIKKPTSYLLNYLENKDSLELKNYIFSFYAQIIIIILDIVLIIIWIVLCYYVSKGRYLYCLRKIRCAKNCFKKTFFIGSLFFYLGIILLNIIILFSFSILFKDINNSFCSLFKIIYHTYNGEETFYEIKPKWTGINQIKNLIQKTRQKLGDLVSNNNQINKNINEIKENIFFNHDINFVESHINSFCDLNSYKVPNPYPFDDGIISEFLYCSDILLSIEKEYNQTFSYYFNEVNNIFYIMNDINNNLDKIEFSFDNAKNKLDSFTKILKDMEIEYFNKLVYIFDTIIGKYIIYFLLCFFIFIFLLEIAGLINLIVLNACYTLYCNKIYNFIWNFQFFSVMILLLIVACSSFINIFIDDISLILKTSYNNQNRTISKSIYDLEGFNICINGEGDLAHYMNLDKEAKSLSHFYSMINIINENLNNIENYNILSEKNETINILNELEQKTFLARFKLFGDENITTAEDILENNLNKYTDNQDNQDLRDNEYYSNYFFVYDKDFCKSDYEFLDINNKTTDSYLKGKNCMLLKDFPEYSNYFKTIRTKNMEESTGYNYYFNDLINKFKQKYYDSDGFEPSFLILLHYSRNYLENVINIESKKIKNDLINIYKIMENKVNIIDDLYKNIIDQNNTDLYSAFNCKYLKRDLHIFLDQLDSYLSHSLYKFTLYCFILAIFSLLSILFSIFSIRLNKMERKIKEQLFKPKEKFEKEDILEKHKVESLRERFNFDGGMKSNINEKTGLKNNSRLKHIIDIDIEKNQ